jgi:hypothetical protein
MDLLSVIIGLTGFILGMIITAVGYHKWFTEYNDTIDDLKNRIKDKNMVIKALQNTTKNGQEV